MKHSTKTLVIGAALSGLLGGTAARASETQPDAPQAMKAMDKKADTHACKGHNACKGQGGCKSSKAGCKGKNECKGQGGCATDGSKDKNSCKGADGCKSKKSGK